MNYPKPKAMGGTLIRRMIALLDEWGGRELARSTNAVVHLACSGGADSVALAESIQKYGRNLFERSKLRLLHVNHGWRGEESDRDEAFVRGLAKDWGIPIDVYRPETRSKTEDAARCDRKQVFRFALAQRPGVILTAHHADDLAETVLWRLLTGGARDQGGGIGVRVGPELRPLLTTRKSELRKFLIEEGLTWHEDRTNQDPKYLRARMRRELMPCLVEVFPKGIEHLVDLGLRAQRNALTVPEVATADPVTARSVKPVLGEHLEGELISVISAQGLRIRRVHREAIQDELKTNQSAVVPLPGGWSLVRHKPAE